MNYKEKYEALLANIKAYHARFGPTCNLKKELEECVPELAESEDERIIDGFRTLLDGISRKGGLTLNKVPLQKCYAYLEKQKEQKPAEWSEEDELRERFHWKPSEEQLNMLLAIVNDPNNAGAESCHLAMQSLYNDLKKLM